MATIELSSPESAPILELREEGSSKQRHEGDASTLQPPQTWSAPGFLPFPDNELPIAENEVPSSQQDQDSLCMVTVNEAAQANSVSAKLYSISSIEMIASGHGLGALCKEDREDEIAASFGELGRKWTLEGRVQHLLETYKATPLWEKVREKGIDPVNALREIYEEDPYTWMEIVMNAAAQAVAEADYGLTVNLRLHRRWAKTLLAIFSLPPSVPEASK